MGQAETVERDTTVILSTIEQAAREPFAALRSSSFQFGGGRRMTNYWATTSPDIKRDAPPLPIELTKVAGVKVANLKLCVQWRKPGRCICK